MSPLQICGRQNVAGKPGVWKGQTDKLSHDGSSEARKQADESFSDPIQQNGTPKMPSHSQVP